LFQIDFKRVTTTFREVFKAVLAILASSDAYLIQTRLWTDFYQVVSQYYFWYADAADLRGCMARLASAHSRRFEMGLGNVELDGNPLYTLIYSRPGTSLTTINRILVLTVDDLISESLKLLKACKSAEQIIFLMDSLSRVGKLEIMSALTQNKFVNSVMEYSHAQGPFFAPQEVRR